MFRVGDIHLKNRFIMAPMAGITNLPFRLMVKRLGAGLVHTEMVSAVGLSQGHEKTRRYLLSSEEEKPLSVQIFGSSAESMAAAAQKAVEAGADIIDVNMGCPVRKVAKSGSGAALLEHPERVAAIIKSVRLACPVPLTAKIRAGWSPGRPMAVEIARILEECGVDAVTIHARYATQRYGGVADWSLIKEIKESVRIPVIGNGDVFTAPDGMRMIRETGCDGVMIGRGAVGNPWIFNQLLDLEKGTAPTEPSLKERRTHILEHYRLLSEAVGEDRAPFMMRGLLLKYTKGLPRSNRFRGRITRIKDYQTLMLLMDDYFGALENAMDTPP